MNNNNTTKSKPTQKQKKTTARKKTQVHLKAKKPTKKMTRAEYDDLRQIEWVLFDPYAD